MRINKSRNIASRVINNEAYIVVPGQSMLYRLNEVGTFIWEILKEDGIEKNEIINKVKEEYDVSVLRAKKDIDEFISNLMKKGILDKI